MVKVLPTLKKICDKEDYRKLFNEYDYGESYVVYEGVLSVGVAWIDGEYVLRAQLRFSDLKKYDEREVLKVCLTFAKFCNELKENEKEILEEAKALL
jgi:hypothetical protein